jgi:dolichol-phosphate mannosyltransferase
MSSELPVPPRVAAVIPAYRETGRILAVLARCGSEIDDIYVVDDACPEGTGRLVEERCNDPRVRVIYHGQNQGVGGATMTGYLRAAEDGATVIIKIDGDGQMDPGLAGHFIQPVLNGEADYAKGNRFYNLSGVRSMPRFRLLGNIALSFITKLSSGYWNLFDPTNGYTAIHANVVRQLSFGNIRRNFFFESDLLFHLNLLRAVVVDVPMDALYSDEQSKLKVGRVIVPFAFLHAFNLARRVFYNYYLRSFSIASIELFLGAVLSIGGATFGAIHWINSVRAGVAATSGAVMLASLPIIVGTQLLLAFLAHDVGNVPTRPIHPLLATQRWRQSLGPQSVRTTGKDATVQPRSESSRA